MNFEKFLRKYFYRAPLGECLRFLMDFVWKTTRMVNPFQTKVHIPEAVLHRCSYKKGV